MGDSLICIQQQRHTNTGKKHSPSTRALWKKIIKMFVSSEEGEAEGEEGMMGAACDCSPCLSSSFFFFLLLLHIAWREGKEIEEDRRGGSPQ